jgi:tetratricopeptide (TPR) repeat protein
MRNSRSTYLLGALLMIGVLLLLVPVQEGIHRARPELFDPHRKARPTGAINFGPAPTVIAALGGFRAVAADLLWLRADQVWHSGAWWALLPILESVTDLDPHFELAWKTYGWHCAYNLNAESKTAVDRNYWLQKGLDILERAVENNPKSWDMAFEYGWTLFDRAGEKERASEWFWRADHLSGAPSYVSRLYYRCFESVLDIKKLFPAMEYAKTRHLEDMPHQVLVKRDIRFWNWAWNDAKQHRRIIAEQNTFRYQRGVAPYLYPDDPFWDVCPVCGMPAPKGPNAVCGNLQCPNYQHPIHPPKPTGTAASAS